MVVIALGIGLMFGTKSNNDNDDSARTNQISSIVHQNNTSTLGATATKASKSIFTTTVTPTIHSNVNTVPISVVATALSSTATTNIDVNIKPTVSFTAAATINSTSILSDI